MQFPVGFGAPRPIIVFTRASQTSLSWASWIQSIPSHFIQHQFQYYFLFVFYISSPWFDRPNDIWWTEKTAFLSSLSGPNIPLNTLLSNTPLSMLFPYYERPSFTPIHDNSQNNTFACLIFTLLGQTGRQKLSELNNSKNSQKFWFF